MFDEGLAADEVVTRVVVKRRVVLDTWAVVLVFKVVAVDTTPCEVEDEEGPATTTWLSAAHNSHTNEPYLHEHNTQNLEWMQNNPPRWNCSRRRTRLGWCQISREPTRRYQCPLRCMPDCSDCLSMLHPSRLMRNLLASDWLACLKNLETLGKHSCSEDLSSQENVSGKHSDVFGVLTATEVWRSWSWTFLQWISSSFKRLP